MSEYISREAAIIGLAASSLTPHQIDDAAEALQLVPAADVAPVRYGRWVWDGGLDGGEDMHYYCSICLHNAYGCTIEILDGKYRYCPNCGAKMDGDGE